MEQSLIIVKPDAVQRGLIGEIVSRFERRGLRFAALKLIQIDRDLAERHYDEHRGKPFFAGLVDFITSSPVVVAVVEGPGAVEATAALVGATKPVESPVGTIRGDFALTIGQNIIHRSDKVETARREIDLFFDPSEILSYSRDVDRWVMEED